VDEQTRGITWLHLTDLHRGGRSDNTYWPTVKAALWEDLRNPPARELATPDIVFFTGDLSFSGQKAQFEDVAKFLGELRTIVGDIPVVAVPGNHDLVRPKDTDRARFLWLRFFTDAFCGLEQEIMWADTSPLRNDLEKMFEPYTAFAECQIIEPLHKLNATLVKGILPGDLFVALSIRDLRVGIVGLNSAWRQFTGGNFERLVTVHPRQLNAILRDDFDSFRQNHHICLLLQHHPPEWLENQQEWEGIIEPNFNITLLGHMHAHDATSGQRNEQRVRRRVQARSLFGIEHYGEAGREDRRFGYSFGHARLEGDRIQLRVWARTLIETPSWRFWHPEDVDYRESEGQHLVPFELPPRLRASWSSSIKNQENAVIWKILLHGILTPINVQKAKQALKPDTAEENAVRIQWLDGEDRWTATAREQEKIVSELIQGREKSPARIAVFSLSPIPLTIHLGYCLSPRIEVKTFQYHNHNDRDSWCWPEHPADIDTEITTQGLPDMPILEKCNGVIRISLSALIQPEDTEEIIPMARFSVDLRVRSPKTTWLVARSQVDAIRRAFRNVLGEIRGLAPRCERLHLFYAGPPPGAIVIGQEINPRMNPPIVLYEYSRSSTPCYRAVLTLPMSP
jgi:hypothetical protein